MTSTVERAQALASSRDIDTRAQTVRGVLRALAGSRHQPAPAVLAGAHQIRVTPAQLVERLNNWEGRARTDLIGYTPLRMMLWAAIAGRAARHGRVVPNCYRGDAYTSTCYARRSGRGVALSFARVCARHVSRGVGRTPAHMNVDRCYVLRVRDIFGALRLPRGWRWAADQYGPMAVRISDGTEYHPTPNDLVECLSAGSCRRLVVKALRNARERAAYTPMPVEALLREHYTVVVEVEDSLEAGNCLQGTEAWMASHGFAGRTSATVGELLAAERSDRVVRACVAAVATAAAVAAAEAAVV